VKKFLAVVKREYVQRVRSKMFLIVTVGAPLMFAVFTVVPILISSIRAGGPVRIAVVDETGHFYEHVRDSLTDERDEDEKQSEPVVAVTQNSRERVKNMAKASEQRFAVEQVGTDGRTLDEVTRDLNERVRQEQFDAYLILPKDILEKGEAMFYARNAGDVFTRDKIKDRLSNAVRDERLNARGITPEMARDINRPVTLKSTRADGGGEDKGEGFWMVFGVGFVIYLTVLMYGQVILGAVIEEKETRIAEILFSSIRAFPLMMGKLIGVSLVALTQFAIWGLAFAAFAIYGVVMLAGQGININLPHLPAGVYVYILLFFLLGYFIYATIYALVGSMVTTAQEGGQLAMPIVLILVVGFWLAFPIIRSPNSQFAFWISMIPFFAPITMLVRIVTQTPPFWQIALSLALGFATVAFLIWLAARVYRVGMLMYGKRATIPEVLKWIRQP
jgi:ABC-2 type transport system permease protein